MSPGENLLEAARDEVHERSQTLLHKIATSAIYTARKKVLHAPRTMGPAIVSKALSHAPLIGQALAHVSDIVLDKVVSKYLATKREEKRKAYGAAAQGANRDQERLRKLAKWEAKSLTQVAGKIDTNQVKFRDAGANSMRSIKAYMSDRENEKLVAAALQDVCEEERYLDKISMLCLMAHASLEQVESYLSEARITNQQAQKFMVDSINERADKGMVSNPLYEAPPQPAFTSNPLYRPPGGQASSTGVKIGARRS